MFTLALAAVIGRTLRLSYEGTNLAVAQYPAHIVIVLWTAILGTLWLRLQEMSEAPSISPVRKSRRAVLGAIILISLIPLPTIVITAGESPLLVAKVLAGTLIGLMLWQHLIPFGRIHRLSDGLESLVILIGGRTVVILVMQQADCATRYMSGQADLPPVLWAGCTVLSLALAMHARRTNNGRGHATTTLYLVAAEILAYLAYPVAASFVRRS